MNSLRLSNISTGESVYVKCVKGKGAFRQRISEMGFVQGKQVTVVKNAPFNDPIEFNIMGYNISLRRNEAAMIEVTHESSPRLHEEPLLPEYLGGQFNTVGKVTEIRVAMVGNPNSGKTSLFNFASRSQEHVGNYTGVTVSSKTSTFRYNDVLFHITDLPGTYSISAYSPEELFVRDFIIEHKPDVVINVVDAANLERNLFLTTQLIDMNVRVVVALNMFDELVRMHDRFDYDSLGRMLGIPFVPTIGSRGKGLKKLFNKVIDVYSGKYYAKRQIRINYGTEVEQSINRICNVLNSDPVISMSGINPRFLALRLLEHDRHIESVILSSRFYKDIINCAREEATRIEKMFDDTPSSVITDARYGFISGALRETFTPGTMDRRKLSDRIDHILTNRYLGIPVFLLFMWVMFSATFNLGAYPQDWIEQGVGYLSGLLNENMPAGSLKQLLSDGLLGGVGGVIVFLPNILILFFFISIMEDTGYMARAAFITDKLMHKIGLHGQSFIPLIMGFGCNVPAIMATRTIENRTNRFLTILINPFMSCSARLPVYILLIGAIFPGYKGTLLFAVYLTGILVAIGIALLFKSTIFKSADAPFVMELPPYRLPTSRSVVKHMWSKASQYLKKMGGIIMVASVLIWALGHYPLQKNATNGSAITYESVHQNSYIARLGKSIEPVIEPLGFDWKMGVCLLTGIAAKEIVVSTMGVVYPSVENGGAESLEDRIRMDRGFTPLSTLSFLLFTLLYFPCLATVTAIYNETSSWKWAGFSIVMTTGVAWILSFLFFQAGSLIF